MFEIRANNDSPWTLDLLKLYLSLYLHFSLTQPPTAAAFLLVGPRALAALMPVRRCI